MLSMSEISVEISRKVQHSSPISHGTRVWQTVLNHEVKQTFNCTRLRNWGLKQDSLNLVSLGRSQLIYRLCVHVLCSETH